MTDKNTIRQVLGGLIQHPQYLSQIDKYSLTIADFSSRFERYIYSAINGLYRQGVTQIQPLDIANFLQADTIATQTFEQNNGVEYLQDIIDFSNADNFDYYYNKLKKLNLLRDLKKQGFDTSGFYEEDLSKPNAEKVNAEFENITTKDICDQIKRKVLGLEASYVKTAEIEVENASVGMEDFIKEMNETYDIGLPLQGHIYNKIFSGAQRGALTIRSGSSGLGKTRQAIGDACYLAYPVRYNSINQEWEQRGSSEKVLFIVTEQTFSQVRKMILAYLTDINESRFKLGHFTSQEKELLNKALQIMNDFADNMILIKMPNPTIESVKAIIRENVLTKNIGYVFYDYIFIGPALLGEFRGFSLRNDEVLLMFATALKDLAVELNVAMFTSTQVNAQADDNRHIRNEASLAGGRSTINKADNGAIMSRPSPEELTGLEPIISKYGKPNMVTDIFKVRSGEWSQVRIWSIVDLGRMKKRDLFVTDERLEPIEDFFNDTEVYEIHNWDTTEENKLTQYVEILNRKESHD